MNAAGGGAALSTLGLIEQFRSVGIESSIVCHDAGTDQEKRRVRKAVEDRAVFRPLYWWNRKIRAATWKRPLIEARQLWQTGAMRASTNDVVACAKRFGADLIHTNTSLTPEGGLAARRLGLAHVWHIRELIGTQYPFRFAPDGRAWGARVAELSSLVVANSYVTAEAIRPWLPPDLLQVVPNGIDVEQFSGCRDSAHSGPIIVAMVASMSSRSKRQGDLLEAATRVTAAVPVEYRIYGHPPTAAARDEWDRRLQALGLTERFRFAGFYADPVQMMSEIDVLVHTAEHESFGRVIVEAMAASIPVVGVRGGGVGEIVVDGVTGYLAPPNDPAEAARLLDRLISDAALRRELGDKGRVRARDEYDVRRTAERMLAAYSEALSRPVSATINAGD
jgi:glycosyltransferase involved in cell wall biosynthesis